MNKAQENEYKLVAERYANALCELAGDDKVKIFDDLNDAYLSIKNSKELSSILESPIVSVDEKKSLLMKIFEKTSSKTILNFLKLLIDKNRFSVLESIVKEYKNIVNDINNLLPITITSAIELSKSDRAMIKVKLEKLLKKQTELDWAVNPDIIAGLVFEFNDNIIDNSLRHKLQDLSRNMIK